MDAPTQQPKPAPSPYTKMWRASFQLGGAVFFACLIYVFLYYGNLSIVALSAAIGGAAAFMIGISYAMSGVGYYFDFLDAKVAYRKYYGLVGLLGAFIYAYTLCFVNPGRYFFGFLYNLGTLDFILGILAMGILVFMVIISTPEGIKTIGAENWRLGLRTGYLASALFVTRATIVFRHEWTEWLRHGHWYLPPLMLIATVFTILVILLRGSIFVVEEIKKMRRQKKSTSPAT